MKDESSPSLAHVEAAPSGFEIAVREQIKSFIPKHAAQHNYSSGVRFSGSVFWHPEVLKSRGEKKSN